MKNNKYKIDEVLFSNDEIKKRITEIAKQINEDYKGKEIIIIGVLRGCIFFLSELLQKINVPLRFDFIRVSSYKGTSSTGEVKVTQDTLIDLEGKHLIIVEDILDTGNTLSFLVNRYKHLGAKSIEIATLINKEVKRKVNIKPKYHGFNIPDKFIVGFGMDVDDMYRNLDYIATIKTL